jgi:formiminotetrahydrofolate cyclodeaminase
MQQKDTFLDLLRRPQPDPGGGSAAAHGALLGLALLEKIMRVEQGRHGADSQEERSWRNAVERVVELTGTVVELRERDVRAYHGLAGELAKRERDPEPFSAALDEAIACPFQIMQSADECLDLVAEAGRECKRFLVADVLVACECVGAGLLGAFHIALANVPLIEGEAPREEWLERLSQCRAKGEMHLNRVRMELESRYAIGRR